MICPLPPLVPVLRARAHSSLSSFSAAAAAARPALTAAQPQPLADLGYSCASALCSRLRASSSLRHGDLRLHGHVGEDRRARSRSHDAHSLGHLNTQRAVAQHHAVKVERRLRLRPLRKLDKGELARVAGDAALQHSAAVRKELSQLLDGHERRQVTNVQRAPELLEVMHRLRQREHGWHAQSWHASATTKCERVTSCVREAAVGPEAAPVLEVLACARRGGDLQRCVGVSNVGQRPLPAPEAGSAVWAKKTGKGEPLISQPFTRTRTS